MRSVLATNKDNFTGGLTFFFQFFFPNIIHIFGKDFLLRSQKDYFQKIFQETMSKREKSGQLGDDTMGVLLNLKMNEKNISSKNFHALHVFNILESLEL